MPARDLESLLDDVTHAGSLSAHEAEPLLRKYLADRNALVVSRAAKYAARLNLRNLAAQLAEVFPRFMPPHDAVKLDPQCWAKHEIVRALAAFEYQPPDIFLAALHYHQWEPTWTPPYRIDTAGPVRGDSALALVQCRDLPSDTLLRHLIPLFVDADLPIRVNVARAVEQIGTQSSSLLLRLRTELASDQPEPLIACIGGVLRLEGEPALPWVAAYLKAEDDLAAETAFLLAEFRRPAALTHLQHAFSTTRSSEFRNTLLQAAAATRLPEAWAWLLDRVARNDLHASAARQVIEAADPPEEVLAALRSSSRRQVDPQ